MKIQTQRCSEMALMLELTDKDFKITIVDMSKNLKRNMAVLNE